MDFSLAAILGVAENASAWTNFLAVAWRVVLVVLGVNMLVIVHEWGHFIVARMCGVRCDKFYIWFDAYGFKFFSFKWGDTEYGLGWLPLGGYVKMLGQEDNPGGIQAEIERAKKEKADADAENANAAEQDEKIAELEKQLYAPDSYLAKNVFQRMAIISAGVFMNVVFAILCAAGAAAIGTPETAATVGYVAPGSPAWESGLQPGDKIVGIGDDKKPIFSSIIVACMDGEEKTFDVLKPGATEPTPIAITPSFEKGDMTPKIGVGPAPSLDLAEIRGEKPFELSLDPAKRAETETNLGALNGGERLISMNGVAVETPADQIRLARLFVDRPIEYVFAPTIAGRGGERTVDETKEPIKVTIPAQGAPNVGVRLTMGEIVAIQPGSPAEKAGLRAREVDETGAVVRRGDVVLDVDNQPILDPTSFPYQIFALAGKETRGGQGAETASGKSVVLTVDRDGERVDVPVTLSQNAAYTGFASSRGTMAAGSLGVAFEVKPTVSGVDGTVKYDSNPLGGRIVSFEAQIPDPGADAPKSVKSTFKALTGKKAGSAPAGELVAATTAIPPLSSAKNVPANQQADAVLNWFSGVLPYLPDGTPVKITVETARENGVATSTIETQVKRSQDVFAVERGLYFGVDSVFSRANSVGEAFQFGVAKTWESASQVFVFLKNVGKNVSAKALGGPGMIVGTAYEAAGRNDGVFLLFLCLIGANLAVVNFLPIPVLDGGHMVFLLYEAITGRQPNETVQVVLSYIGLFLILALMFWVIFLDVVRYCF